MRFNFVNLVWIKKKCFQKPLLPGSEVIFQFIIVRTNGLKLIALFIQQTGLPKKGEILAGTSVFGIV